MAKRRKHEQYDVDFKCTAVRLSNHPEIRTQDVAAVLKIHPFMLSRWKKEYREGRFMNKSNENSAAAKLEKANRRIQQLEKQLARVQVENDLLKKARRFLSDGKERRSPTSKGTGKSSR